MNRTCATQHVYSDNEMFISFEPIGKGENLYMGYSTMYGLEDQGKLILQMTFGKKLDLNNVLYMLEIHKILISRLLLNTNGFWMVFESYKVVLSKSGMYIGKGYIL